MREGELVKIESVTILIIFSILLAGCTEGIENSEQKTLQVLYYDEQSFFEHYGSLFEFTFPNYEVEVISSRSLNTSDKFTGMTLPEIIEREYPQIDVLVVNNYQYKQLVEENMLMPLNGQMNNGQFDKESLLPAVIEILTHEDGSMYGLAPYFDSKALYFNKDIFDTFHLPYPIDNMNWSDVIELAQRFPQASDPQGLSAPYISNFHWILQLGREYGLSVYDGAGNLNLSTNKWKEIFEMIIRLEQHRSGNTGEKNVFSEPFLNGRSAMTISGSEFIDQLEHSQVFFDWDLVSVPVNPLRPGATEGYDSNSIFSINANSDEPEGAWDLVQFVNSEETAKKLRFLQNGLMSRADLNQTDSGKNIEALWRLNFDRSFMYEVLPMGLDDYANQLIEEIAAGETGLDNALKMIGQRGTELLIEERNKLEQ